MKFYKNSKTNEVRIVKQLSDEVFAVVKLLKPGVYTLKIWHGPLGPTEAAWNTKRFAPDHAESRALTQQFQEVWNEMKKFFK